jgi:hypothetical protein
MLDIGAPVSRSNVSVLDSNRVLLSSSVIQAGAVGINAESIPPEDTTLNMATCPTPGAYFYVGVYADWPRDIPEWDETNNYADQVFYCPGPDQPPVVELIAPCDCCNELGVFIGCP